MITISGLVYVFFWLMDVVISDRLRGLAYGNDCSTPMSRVETFPWPGTEVASVPLSNEIELAAENYIAERTGLIWSKVRFHLTPNTPLLNQDVRQLAENVLTGDELVHTVYYCVEAFIDVIVVLLVRSEQWSAIKKVSPSDQLTSQLA